jgi:hypothetical protein
LRERIGFLRVGFDVREAGVFAEDHSTPTLAAFGPRRLRVRHARRRLSSAAC